MAWCQPPGIQTKREVPWVLRSEAMENGAVWILEIFTNWDGEGFNWGNLGLFVGISCFELETWEPDHYHGVCRICCIYFWNIPECRVTPHDSVGERYVYTNVVGCAMSLTRSLVTTWKSWEKVSERRLCRQNTRRRPVNSVRLFLDAKIWGGNFRSTLRHLM